MIGVRSSYFLNGEAGSTIKDIVVVVYHNNEVTSFNYNRELKEGDSLNVSPVIRDFFNHKLRVLNVLEVIIAYKISTEGAGSDVDEEFTFKAVDGYNYYDEPLNSDLYKNKHFLLSSENLKIGGERFYFFFDAKHQSDKLTMKSYPNGVIDTVQDVTIGLHYIELNNYNSEEYIVLSVEDEEEIIIEIERETKYKTYEIDFLNKFGVWERMFFTKKDTESLNVESSEYRSIGANEFLKYSINGRGKLNLNTFWIPQDMNETIKQLMLSEEVYVNDKKYNIEQKSVNFKSRVNDGLINYEIQFINANNLIR